MTTTKFTPGPWIIDTETRPAEVCTVYHTSHENGYVYVRGELGYWEADGEENMANAHLIAAAPELYEALADLARDYKEPLDADTTKYFVEQAEKALAKAEGKQ